MVKLDQNSGEPDLSQSVGLNNGSCSAEATQADLKQNELSHHALKVSAVNGSSPDKLPVKEIPKKCENEKYINKLPINTAKPVEIKWKPWRDSVEDPVLNGNCGDDSPVEVPVPNGKCKDSRNYSNGSKTPSESGSSTISHVSDSLYNEAVCDENEHGFIEVVSKKKLNKNRRKNRRTKSRSNLPPGLNAEGVRCDNVNDKNNEKASSPTHLSQKPPTRNFAAVRSSAKSYSAVVANGQKNDVPKVSSDCLNVTICAKSNKSNSDLLGTKTFTSVILAAKSKAAKVQMSHVSAQTDTRFEMSPSQIACLKSLKVNPESEKSSSPIDYVEDKEIGETDESSNTAYCESVVIEKGHGECADVENHVIKHGDGESSDFENHVIEMDHGECAGIQNHSIQLQPSDLWPAIYEYNQGRNPFVFENGRFVYFPCFHPWWLINNFVSNNSGRGDSEVIYDNSTPYCCYFPRAMVKNLIGKRGRYRFEILERSGANFWVPKDYFIDEDTTIITFTGTGAQIERAKQILQERFDVPLTQYLGPRNVSNGPPLSDTFSATLPIGIEFMGVVSCIFTPQYFWMQQYGHPGFHPLEDLERRMSNHFNTVVDAPGVENPEIGHVVAVPVFIEGESEKWVRGEIIHIIPESGNVIARYLDHGGESEVPASVLRPMRHEFLSIPFFAAKCCLLGVLPQDGAWSEAACAELKRLCNSSLPPMVKALYKVQGGYLVSIHGFDDEANVRVDVAVTLVAKGLALFDSSIVPAPEPSNEIVN